MRDEGECSYSIGKFNEVDPLAQVGSESSDDEDDYPLAQLVLNKDSDTSDEDVQLAQIIRNSTKNS